MIQAAQCLWGFNKNECYVVGIIELKVGNSDRLVDGSTPPT